VLVVVASPTPSRLPFAIAERKQIRVASHMIAHGHPVGEPTPGAACAGGSKRAFVRPRRRSIPSSSIVSSCASIRTQVVWLVTCAGKQKRPALETLVHDGGGSESVSRGRGARASCCTWDSGAGSRVEPCTMGDVPHCRAMSRIRRASSRFRAREVKISPGFAPENLGTGDARGLGTNPRLRS
jgi:hypothetical protein